MPKTGSSRIYCWPHQKMENGGLEHFYFSIYWEESPQLTIIFFRGVAQPPTRNSSHGSHRCLDLSRNDGYFAGENGRSTIFDLAILFPDEARWLGGLGSMWFDPRACHTRNGLREPLRHSHSKIARVQDRSSNIPPWSLLPTSILLMGLAPEKLL